MATKNFSCSLNRFHGISLESITLFVAEIEFIITVLWSADVAVCTMNNKSNTFLFIYIFLHASNSSSLSMPVTKLPLPLLLSCTKYELLALGYSTVYFCAMHVFTTDKHKRYTE